MSTAMNTDVDSSITNSIETVAGVMEHIAKDQKEMREDSVREICHDATPGGNDG